MWVSGREARRILAPAVSGDAQATAVLQAGLAGAPLTTGRGPLYDERLVRALAGKAVIDEYALAAACPLGLYVARLARSVQVDATQPWADLTRSLGSVPRMPGLTSPLLGVRITLSGRRLPWVATLCGFVVTGGEILGLREVPRQAMAFVLEPPGMWFSVLEERRLPTTVGGRPWHLWIPPLDRRTSSACE
jgi:hypothetical protein